MQELTEVMSAEEYRKIAEPVGIERWDTVLLAREIKTRLLEQMTDDSVVVTQHQARQINAICVELRNGRRFDPFCGNRTGRIVIVSSMRLREVLEG